MPWMVNGCGLITDNDFQISIKTFFTIFYIPYILWLYKTGFVMGQGESTHGEQPSSGAVWRHRGEGEEKPLQPRHINPYIRIQSRPGRLTRACSGAPSGISNMNEIFPHFSAVNGITSRAVGTLGPISLDAMQQPSPASDQMDVGDN